MKKILLILATTFLLSAKLYGADLYKIDPSHTNLVWHADHFGFSSPNGKFTDIEGKINLDERNIQNSSVEITIKTNSVNTGFTKLDSHLKSPDFFDVEKFPIATFKSTSIKNTQNSLVKVYGILTIKDIKKPITLNVKINKIGKNPITGNKTIGMSIEGEIKRSDFDIIYGLPNIGNKVILKIESEAIYQGSEVAKKENIASWEIIENKSKLEFSASQGASIIKGAFKKFNGKIDFDPNIIDKGSIEIEVDIASIDMSFTEALETVKTENWLASSSFPKAIFKSNNFKALPGKNNFSASGTLELKGKKMPLSLNFNLKSINDRNAYAIGSTTIKRSDFGIGDKNINKANGINEEILINFEISAKKK